MLREKRWQQHLENNNALTIELNITSRGSRSVAGPLRMQTVLDRLSRPGHFFMENSFHFESHSN